MVGERERYTGRQRVSERERDRKTDRLTDTREKQGEWKLERQRKWDWQTDKRERETERQRKRRNREMRERGYGMVSLGEFLFIKQFTPDKQHQLQLLQNRILQNKVNICSTCSNRKEKVETNREGESKRKREREIRRVIQIQIKRDE